MPPLILLILEFSLIYVTFPLLILCRLLPNLPIPYLLLTAFVAYLILRHNRGAHSAASSSSSTSRRGILSLLPGLLLRDSLFLALLGLTVGILAPQLLFSLVRRAPLFWALIMLLYPLLSVYPQEFLYRAFFFERYKPLFGSGWGMILASSLAFGFVHIIFGNWLAVGLCCLGGFLFSLTYQHSGSLLLTCIDHAIFGNFIFTIGLGQFFYHGYRL